MINLHRFPVQNNRGEVRNSRMEPGSSGRGEEGETPSGLSEDLPPHRSPKETRDVTTWDL